MLIALSDFVRYLLFPLGVLLTGAVVTGVLIPELTRRRDDYRKALEIRTGLISEISETVMNFIIAMRFAVHRAVSQEQKEYDDAYKTWEVASAVLGTKLEAFFAGSRIPHEWEQLEDYLRRLYSLTETCDQGDRDKKAHALLAELGLLPSQAAADGRDQKTAWRDTWDSAERAILDRKASLILDVLDPRVDAPKPPLLGRQTSLTRGLTHDGDRGQTTDPQS
jgi:hypothetical protein